MTEVRNTILVVGSANLDYVVRAAHVPAPGETVLGRDFAMFPGGKGANQAVACARAGGAPTRMLLALGDDTAAKILEDSLRSAGVEMHVIRSDLATGCALICLADDAENAITVAPGANEALRAEHLPPLDTISHLLMQLETPIESVTAYAQATHKAGIDVILNAAPARPLPDDLLAAIDVLIVNEGELAIVSGIDKNIAAALEALPVPCVIVTLGARGVCARERTEQAQRFYLQPAFAIEAIDTTGAGDTFCGAFTAALNARLDMPHALARASAAAAIACTRMGAQSSVPTRDEVDAFLVRANVNDSSVLRKLADYCKLPA